jgi:hypothetical protein
MIGFRPVGVISPVSISVAERQIEIAMKITRSCTVLALFAIVGLTSELGRAGVTACGSTNAVNLGATNPGGIIGTGAAGNTPSQGCGQTDLGFNSFVVTPTVGGADLPGPANGTIDPTATGGTITGGDAIGNISLDFAGAFTTTSHSGAHTMDESISYVATPNLGGSAEEPTTPAGYKWALTGVAALSIVGDTITGGPTIPVGNGTAPTDVYMLLTERAPMRRPSPSRLPRLETARHLRWRRLLVPPAPQGLRLILAVSRAVAALPLIPP